MMTLEIEERRRVRGGAPRRPAVATATSSRTLPAVVVLLGDQLAGSARGARDADHRCRTSARSSRRSLGFTRAGVAVDRAAGRSGCTRTTAIGSSTLADRSTETGEPFTAEYRYLAKDGRIVWVLDRATLRSAGRTWTPRALPGRDARHHGAEGGRGEGRGRRGALPAARRARARSRLVRVPRGPADPPVELEYVSPQIDDAAWAIRRRSCARTRAAGSRWCTPTTSRAREPGAAPRPWSHRRAAGPRVPRDPAPTDRSSGSEPRASVVERDDDGRPCRFQGAMLDVTAERAARRRSSASEVRAAGRWSRGSPPFPWTADRRTPRPGRTATRTSDRRRSRSSATRRTSSSRSRRTSRRMVHPDDRSAGRTRVGGRRGDRRVERPVPSDRARRFRAVPARRRPSDR